MSEIKFGKLIGPTTLEEWEFKPDPDTAEGLWFSRTGEEVSIEGLEALKGSHGSRSGACVDTMEFFSPAALVIKELLKEAPQSADWAAIDWNSSVGTRTWSEEYSVDFYNVGPIKLADPATLLEYVQPRFRQDRDVLTDAAKATSDYVAGRSNVPFGYMPIVDPSVLRPGDKLRRLVDIERKDSGIITVGGVQIINKPEGAPYVRIHNYSIGSEEENTSWSLEAAGLRPLSASGEDDSSDEISYINAFLVGYEGM